MNEFVYRSTPASKYATFFYAQLDEQRRQLRYVNAGHNAPYLLRAGRRSTAGSAPPEIEELSVGGTVVGMFPEMEYEEATVELCPGDVLLAFTDGVPEAHNPEDEEFGEERLQQLLRQTAHLPADEISARLSDEMKDWIRDAEQYDDLTFIVMPANAPLSQPITGQAAAITVVAEDDGSGGPIDGVAITIRFASPDSRTVTLKGTTFADGKMEFQGLAPGRYFVTASSSELSRSAPVVIGRTPSTLGQSEAGSARDHRVPLPEACGHKRAGADLCR